jgi:predicted HAD superfamily Cof-like phosphohydrolase
MNDNPLNDFLAHCMRFQEEVVNIKVPDRPTRMSPARAAFRASHIREEVQELVAAANALGDDSIDLADMADAFVDIIYIALGGLIEMGVTPGQAFNEVHRANMEKKRGEVSKRPGSQGHDAIKPEDWIGPRAEVMLALDPSTLAELSPVAIEVARLRAKKGQDYNSEVKLTDYFPLGHLSYFQMVYMKTKRTQSLLDVLKAGGTPNFEGLRDTLLDLVNYTTFWVEALDRGEL